MSRKDINDLRVHFIELANALAENDIFSRNHLRFMESKRLPNKFKQIDDKLDALAEYLGVEFKAIPAQDSKMRAVEKNNE